MWPTLGPAWSCRPHVSSTSAPWILLSGKLQWDSNTTEYDFVALFCIVYVCARRTMNMRPIRIDQWPVHSLQEAVISKYAFLFQGVVMASVPQVNAYQPRWQLVYSINICAWYSQNNRSIPKWLTTYKINYANDVIRSSFSPGYLLIYPPQIAAVMKPISFCSEYNPVSYTKSLGESREWNMVFQGTI